MVKYIEELAFYPELDTLSQGKPFRKIKVAPEEIGTTQGIAAEVSELAVLWVVAAGTLACARINRRYKGVRIEPLDRAGLRDARDRMMRI